MKLINSCLKTPFKKKKLLSGIDNDLGSNKTLKTTSSRMPREQTSRRAAFKS